MATRKLIFAALVCGLAILLAGGVWLVSSSSDDDANDELLVVGQTATVGDVVVTVADGQSNNTDAVLVVDMAVAPDGPSEVTDLATGWSLLSPTGAPVTRATGGEAPGGLEPCDTATATSDTPARCFVSFTLTEPAGSLIGFTAVYERDGDRAAWLVQ